MASDDLFESLCVAEKQIAMYLLLSMQEIHRGMKTIAFVLEGPNSDFYKTKNSMKIIINLHGN